MDGWMDGRTFQTAFNILNLIEMQQFYTLIFKFNPICFRAASSFLRQLSDKISGSIRMKSHDFGLV